MKTITYNPETHVIVPREPSEEMLQAALRANMRHVIDCINDPTKYKDIGSEETCKQTHRSRYASMIAAAPQPETVESEPVAYRHRDGMLSCRLPGGPTKGVDWTPLYSEAQYIAAQQRTAEACAMVYLDTYDLTDIAEAIRGGAWKEYQINGDE